MIPSNLNVNPVLNQPSPDGPLSGGPTARGAAPDGASHRESLRALLRLPFRSHLGNHLRNRRGMTLLEIMVVIAIIGILSSAIGFGVVNYMQKAKVDTTNAQLRTMANAIDLYAVENDFPTDLREVVDSKLLKEKQMKDVWKEDIIYNYPASRSSENRYDLCSKGADKIEGNDDDVCND